MRSPLGRQAPGPEPAGTTDLLQRPSPASVRKRIHMPGLRLLLKRITRPRIAALLVAMSIMGAQVEIALPDSHLGDPRPTHLAGASTQEEPSRAPADTHGSGPAQAVHMDHCAHAHVFASAAEAEIAATMATRSGPPVTATRLPHSVTIPPHSRPPIA